MSDINDFILSKLERLDEKLDDIKLQNISIDTASKNHEAKDALRHEEVMKLSGQLDGQSKLLGDYNDSLKEHIRRTELLEKKVDANEVRFSPIEKEYKDKQVEAEVRHKWGKKWVAIAGAIGTIIGVAAAIQQLISSGIIKF